MPHYRKKPVVIEAVSAGDLPCLLTHEFTLLPAWVVDAYGEGVIVLRSSREFVIKTLEGDCVAGLNHMIIRGVKGELYPCDLDIFNETYERTEAPHAT